MAGEAGTEVVTEAQAIPPDALRGSEDEGSLASILEETPQIVFSGHPGEVGFAESGEIPQDLEISGEAPVSPEPPAKPEKKYQTWEAAEAGALEHQRFATEKAEEAKQAREAREAVERERDELKEKLAGGDVAKSPEKPAVSEEEAEARIEAALGEIGQLDEFDPNYKRLVAKAWRRAGIGEVNSEEITKEVARRVRDEIKAENEATRHVREETDIRTQAVELAGKGGLNMEEGSADHILFWNQAAKLPQEMQSKPFDEQVNWTVNEVRRLKGQVVQTKSQQDAMARQEQTRNTVLERGATRPQVPVKSEPVSLGAILNSHKELRRI